MKLTLPIFGYCWCGSDVAVSIQLLGEKDKLVIRCTQISEVWGDNGVYSGFGLIEFDTNDIKMQCTKIIDKEVPCIDYKDIKFTPKTERQMRDWFYEHYQCFVDKE